MGKLVIRDDCLAPDRFTSIKYDGPNPLTIIKKIASSIKPFFHVTSSGTAQPKYLIDNSGESVKFYSEWWARIEVSRWTYIWIKFKVRGNESKREGSGDFHLQLWGYVETNFEARSILLKPFWLIYSYIFYDRVRRRYIERCRNLLLNFRNEIKEYYNLETTDIPKAQGAYG